MAQWLTVIKLYFGGELGNFPPPKTHACIDPHISICRSNTSVPFLPGNSQPSSSHQSRAGVWGPLVLAWEA